MKVYILVSGHFGEYKIFNEFFQGFDLNDGEKIPIEFNKYLKLRGGQFEEDVEVDQIEEIIINNSVVGLNNFNNRKFAKNFNDLNKMIKKIFGYEIFDTIDITVENIKTKQITKPYQIKVDRSNTFLGNPYHCTDESKREQVCRKHNMHFYRLVNEKDKFIVDELNRLKEIYKKHNQLELFCWCVPKKCHAETIAEYLIKNIYYEQKNKKS